MADDVMSLVPFTVASFESCAGVLFTMETARLSQHRLCVCVCVCVCA